MVISVFSEAGPGGQRLDRGAAAARAGADERPAGQRPRPPPWRASAPPPRRPRTRGSRRSGYSGVRPVSTWLMPRPARDGDHRARDQRHDDEGAEELPHAQPPSRGRGICGRRAPGDHLAGQRRDGQRGELRGRDPAEPLGVVGRLPAQPGAVGLDPDAPERDRVAGARPAARRARPARPCRSAARARGRAGRAPRATSAGTSHIRPISRPSRRRTSSTRPSLSTTAAATVTSTGARRGRASGSSSCRPSARGAARRAQRAGGTGGPPGQCRPSPPAP